MHTPVRTPSLLVFLQLRIWCVANMRSRPLKLFKMKYRLGHPVFFPPIMIFKLDQKYPEKTFNLILKQASLVKTLYSSVELIQVWTHGAEGRPINFRFRCLYMSFTCPECCRCASSSFPLFEGDCSNRDCSGVSLSTGTVRLPQAWSACRSWKRFASILTGGRSEDKSRPGHILRRTSAR